MKSKQHILNVTSSGIMEDILVSRIHHSKLPLRDPNANVDDLKMSISEIGLLHPIVVRVDNDEYEVVSGNRRFSACKQLGWKQIMAHIIELQDKEAFEVSIIENLQHKSLNPIEEAIAYRSYVKQRGWGGSTELAKKIGKSHSYISNRIRLLELPSDILDKIVCQQTSPSVAQEMLAIDNTEVRVTLMKQVLDDNLTRDEVRKIIHKKESTYDDDYLSNKSVLSKSEKQLHHQERVIVKMITSLRIAMMRMDDALNTISKNDWLLWENLMHYRTTIHKEIDDLILLKKKMKLYHNRL